VAAAGRSGLSLTPSRARTALAIGAAVLAMLIYASQFVLSRWSMQRTLSLWDLAALRFTVAGLLSLPIVVRHPPSDALGRLSGVKTFIREQARELRASGRSVREIEEALGVARSSVSRWR